jgi:uncharacterized protein (TIGR03067 family)
MRPRDSFLPFFVLSFFASAAITADAQSLDGTWEITAVIDNGRVVEPTEVMLNYAADGRVVIRGQQVELIVPMTYQRKRLPFLVDNSKSPMTFDLAGAEKTGGRGIFLASKDSLVLCLSSRDKGRPTSFASLPGSGSLLVTLRKNTGSGGTPGFPTSRRAFPRTKMSSCGGCSSALGGIRTPTRFTTSRWATMAA